MLKRHSMRFAAALLVALASLVVSPNAAPAAALPHHKQVPGFYRLKVGDLEVTALFDGAAVADPNWLNGAKTTMDVVVKALQEDPHMLEAAVTGFRGWLGLRHEPEAGGTRGPVRLLLYGHQH